MADQDDHDHQPHLPPSTFWPIGFAIGVATLLVGLIINPVWIASIGGVTAIVFGFLWAREATDELRGKEVTVEAERRARKPAVAVDAGPGTPGAEAMPHPEPGERFPRSKFLEGSTLGLGAVIGGVVTVPVAGFAILPSFLGQKRHEVDLGPITDLKEGQWYVATFTVDPEQGEVSRRTAFVRNNGTLTTGGKQVPSFTIISNRCAHLGCPVQANGPAGAILGLKTIEQKTANGKVSFSPTVPAGFGCPCHGGQYDTEGNRTAGPPVRALDRYGYLIKNGRLILTSQYSVSKVEGTGAQARIHKYKLVGPGEHVDGPEQWFYPINPPHH
ncbi:MAG TPA: Rieske 2Fe-2S domain-containing protein [Gaiellaceae bacterium]|nr:Rieske 2Fe-2S domain-containing protein [Gaiellaceae bacterium]